MRGLLKPENAYGLQSDLREITILHALAAEKDAQDMIEQIRIQATFVPVLRGDGAKRLLVQLAQMLRRFTEYKEGNIWYNDGQPDSAENIEAAVKVYELLEKKGLLTD
jgi:hypothetical protein